MDNEKSNQVNDICGPAPAGESAEAGGLGQVCEGGGPAPVSSEQLSAPADGGQFPPPMGQPGQFPPPAGQPIPVQPPAYGAPAAHVANQPTQAPEPSKGKSSGARTCGIIALVVLIIAGVIVGLVVFLGASLFSTVTSVIDSEVVTEETSNNSESSDVDLQGSTLEAAGIATYDAMQNKDSETAEQAAESTDDLLELTTGFDLDDMGVDEDAFGEWLLTDFKYEIVNMTDNGSGSGTVYANVTVRDVTVFVEAYDTNVDAAKNAGEFDGLDETAEAAKRGEIFLETMKEPATLVDYYSSLNFVQSGDTWTIDEDSWETEIKYLFGFVFI